LMTKSLLPHEQYPTITACMGIILQIVEAV